MKNIKKIIGPFALVALVVFSIFWSSYNSKKYAYVNTTLVYDNFTLKKELETKYKTVQLVRQNLLDSIKFKIQYLSIKGKDLSENDKTQINELQRSYLYKEKEFNTDNEATAQQYSEQIWKQINQYMDDYGKENGYDCIFGATGQGNIMYAKENDDITKAITDYINNKYSGGK
ncbi:MAG: OmpH family outer membrane protein [Nitrososphaeraceae archaeon]